jgi:hypothetical protein
MIQFSACPIGLFTTPLAESDKEVDERHYQLWQIENGVAEGSTCQDNAILK